MQNLTMFCLHRSKFSVDLKKIVDVVYFKITLFKLRSIARTSVVQVPLTNATVLVVVLYQDFSKSPKI